MIKDNLIIFINCLIDKPEFSSQTKEELKSKVSDFGSEYILSDKLIKHLVTNGIIDQVVNLVKMKDELALKKKTDGKKINNIRIPKYESANFAGTKQSNKCYLILTEGDSAKALAMSGRSVVGNDYYGVFPLKGKLLNVREATVSQKVNNEEIKNLKKIIGLKEDKVYKDINDLRYGKIIILADQDYDGFHIKGLIINWLHNSWPELLQLGFVTALGTPIISVQNKKIVKRFYTINDYNIWKKNKNITKWHIKYYKIRY